MHQQMHEQRCLPGIKLIPLSEQGAYCRIVVLLPTPCWRILYAMDRALLRVSSLSYEMMLECAFLAEERRSLARPQLEGYRHWIVPQFVHPPRPNVTPQCNGFGAQNCRMASINCVVKRYLIVGHDH